MDISVIIPAYNASGTIEEQLDSLVNQEFDGQWEVIVVDNGSDDNTLEIVNTFSNQFKNLKTVTSVRKKGASSARNDGAERAEGRFLLFCDADDVAGEGWLREMAIASKKHNFIACRWEMEKLNPFNTSRPKHGGQADGLMEFPMARYLPFAGAGSIGILKKLHQEAGGFDESLMVVEDTDYCWRVQLMGTDLIFVPDAVMHIRFVGETAAEYRQSATWAEANVMLYKKYLDRGMPEISIRSSVRAVSQLLKKYRLFFSANGRKAIAWRAGRLAGSCKGSIKNGVIAIR